MADFLDAEDVADTNPPANHLSPVSDTYNIRDAIRVGLIRRLKSGRRLVLPEAPSLQAHIDYATIEINFEHPGPVSSLELHALMGEGGNCMYPVSAYSVPSNPENQRRLDGISLLQKPPLNAAKPPFKLVMDCFLDMALGRYADDLPQHI